MREGSPYQKHYRRFFAHPVQATGRGAARPVDPLKSLLDTPTPIPRSTASASTPWASLPQTSVLAGLRTVFAADKDDIRANRDRMVADNIPKDRLLPKKTSGSTGVSLSFFVDEDSLQWKRGCTLRHDEWTGCVGRADRGGLGQSRIQKSWRLCPELPAGTVHLSGHPAHGRRRHGGLPRTDPKKEATLLFGTPIPCTCRKVPQGPGVFHLSAPKASSPRPWSCTISSATSLRRSSAARSPTATLRRRSASLPASARRIRACT